MMIHLRSRGSNCGGVEYHDDDRYFATLSHRLEKLGNKCTDLIVLIRINLEAFTGLLSSDLYGINILLFVPVPSRCKC